MAPKKSTETTSASAENRPAPPKSGFPQANGRSMSEVLEPAGPTELVLSPEAMVFYKGQNRYPAVAALYTSEDFIEGPKAFAERRPPQWKGR